jgi:hypothetical protein
MYSWDVLPHLFLKPAGPVTAEVIARGISDFRMAARYLQALPYGRTADRADFRAVLREGKGTCSMLSSQHSHTSKISRSPSP